MVGRRAVIVAAFLAAALGTSVTAALADPTGGAGAPAAVKPPKPLAIAGIWEEGTAPNFVGSASGRGWIGFPDFANGGLRLALGSIAYGGGRLSFTRAALAAWNPMFIIGSRLVYHLPDVSGTPGPLRAMPLQTTRRLGAPKAVPDDPEGIPPEEYGPVVVDGVQVGDRTVWVMTGAEFNDSGNLVRSYLWACCTSTGELRDLTRFIKQGRRSYFTQIGIDSKKRLSLAWLEGSRSAVVGSVKLLELDPETLAPRTPTAATVPGGRTATTFELSCHASCRVAMTDLLSGDVLSSAAGERSPTRMASGTREQPASLLAASAGPGHLVAASFAFHSQGPTRAPTYRIRVVRGNARGVHSRSVGSVDLPSVINPLDYDNYFMFQAAYATFVPRGLAYFATYYGRNGTRVLTGVLPLR